MKHVILISVFIAFSTLSLAQKPNNWTLGVNASSCVLNDDLLTLSRFAVEPGYQWNERIYVGLSIGYVENLNLAKTETTNFKGMMNSLSFSLRLLEPEYGFSPMIGLELGNVFVSNAKGAYMTRDFVMCNDGQNELMGTFRGFTSFARMKFMLDIQLADFNFRFGPNYNVSTIRMYEVVKYDDYSNVLQGMGVELGFLYTFKRKKQKENTRSALSLEKKKESEDVDQE